MDGKTPAGWDRDSDTLYLHASGARIERRVYRDKDGWALVPVDLDLAVRMFPPDPAGRDQAFAAFAEAFAAARGRRKAAEPAEKPDEESDDDDES